MKISLKALICGVLLLAMGTAAYAGFANPEQAIGYRKAVMTVIVQHFENIAAVVKGQVPFAKKEVAHDAMVIETMAALPWEAVMFPGSDEGDTTLNPSAMKEKDKFMSVAGQLESAAKKLADAVNSGDLAAVKAQFGEVAGVCKTCHTTYRKR